MEAGDLRQLLEQVRSGTQSIEAAVAQLRAPAVGDLGYAMSISIARAAAGFPR